ncbi:MAG: radical SAM protein [Rhodospirillaceae bacterium]|jgi:anaerobic magnesium-protoporphyrin IX monomethyl ester cyclase|nr:radical SAM protein [Rhodospirillaceae bacterium]MBT5456558.1 radical SAM protein [Rhodospirillaceae bacterium]
MHEIDVGDRAGIRIGESDFRQGQISETDSFDAIARLKAIARKPLPDEAPVDGLRAMHISLYCNKSFPIRIFHALSLKDDVNSTAVFFKNNFTNDHLPVTPHELDLLRELVAKTNPQIVTMSIMAPYVPAANEVIAEIRKVSEATIIVGGKYPTISPDEALETADYACKGEGELLLLRIFERLRQGRDLKGLKGLWYKDESGEIVDMDQEQLYQELDDVPYPAVGECQMYFIEQDVLTERDTELDDDEMLMMAGRGCVYLCSFCVNSLLIPMNRGNGQFVRMRSPEHVIEEVNYRRGKIPTAKMICFNDEVFGVFDDWVEDFCGKYKDQVNLPFECELVPKLIKEHNVRKLVDAGMFSLHFGIQSGHDETRREIMHRPGTNAELVEKAALLDRLGVEPQFDIILDNPFDTAEALEGALDFLLQLPRPFNLNTYKMQYFPYYPFTKMAIAAGHVKEEDVSYEKVAESVLYNMVYRPKFPGTDRRDYLENCIYLLPWDNDLVFWLVRRLRKQHSAILARIATILAMARYRSAFEGRMGLIWLRRVYLGLRLLLRGDVSSLWRRVVTVLKKPAVFRPKTGRISSRS